MNYRITDLRNFSEIADCRTLREGAEKLGISPPALSESIKRLEFDLEEVLFYRSRSGISLTPGGQRIFRKALMALESLDSVASEKNPLDSRLITLGCHSTIASYFLPQALALVQKKNPFYRIRLRHDLSRNIQLAVQHGEIDIALVVNAVPVPDLVVRVLAQDEVCIWSRAQDSQGVESKIFCNLSLFQTQSLLRRWKDKPANLVDTESLELIARLTSDGLGYGIFPQRMLEMLNIKNCKRTAGAPVFKDKISLVYRPEFGKHPSEKILIDSLKEAVV